MRAMSARSSSRDEDVPGPAELPGHPDVELAFEGLLAAGHDHEVLGPTDFSNQ